jgi:hypothetical protein
MLGQTMTFEEALAATRATSTRIAAATTPGVPASLDVCGVYKMVRPIVSLLRPILPRSFQQAIDDFLNVMDALCPAAAARGVPQTHEEADLAIKEAAAEHAVALVASGKGAGAASPSGPPAGKICPVYKAIRPVLQFIAGFVPLAWKAGILAFIAVFDQLCP